MYVLGPRDQISIPVRFDSVETVFSETRNKDELSIKASLQLSPNVAEPVRVILWANVEYAKYFTVSEEFVAHDVTVEAFCNEDHANPYGRTSAGLAAIWSGKTEGKRDVIALIRSEDWTRDLA